MRRRHRTDKRGDRRAFPQASGMIRDCPLTEMITRELFDAVEKRNFQLVRIIHKSLRNPNARGKMGKTILMAACESGQKEVAEFLVGEGADIHAKDENGIDAMVYAIRNGHNDIVEFLSSKGIDANGKTESGVPYLVLANTSEQIDIVKFLIDNEADVNKTNKEGKSILTFAKSEEMIGLLKEAGAK